MNAIKQLAAMYASMDWDPKLYKIIRYYQDDEVINGYSCYKIYDYAAGPSYISSGRGITTGRNVIFEIEIDVKNGKTYTISGDFMAGSVDRADPIYFAIKGSDDTTKVTRAYNNSVSFNYNNTNKRTITYTYTAPTDGILRLQIQYYNSGQYCYLIKDSLKVTQTYANDTAILGDAILGTMILGKE